MIPKNKILIVDDKEYIARSISRSLSRYFDILITDSAFVAFKILELNDFHVVISDLSMPMMSGIELLKMIMLEKPKTHRILMTAQDFNPQQYLETGVINLFLQKPFDHQVLINHLSSQNKM